MSAGSDHKPSNARSRHMGRTKQLHSLTNVFTKMLQTTNVQVSASVTPP